MSRDSRPCARTLRNKLSKRTGRAERWPRITQFNRGSLLFHGSSSLSAQIPKYRQSVHRVSHSVVYTVVLKSHYSEKINI